MARDLDRYELLEPIGRGGMAVVYLARHRGLDKRVAIKELDVLLVRNDPSFAERFLREARTAGALSHPNIVPVLDYFEHDGTAYIAMEYAERGSLRDFGAPLRLEQVAGVMEGVLAGLAHAARHNIVHRDLKPDNLLISSDGRIGIADFGIAKALSTTLVGARAALTDPRAALGTPQYMSPEQAKNVDVGVSSDLYAVGVIAYELLVGRTPFAHSVEPLSILLCHVNDPPPDPRSFRPDLDPELAQWTLWLLSKTPAERPGTPALAWEQLETIITRLLGPHWRRGAPLLETDGHPPAASAPVLSPPPPEPVYAPEPPVEEPIVSAFEREPTTKASLIKPVEPTDGAHAGEAQPEPVPDPPPRTDDPTLPPRRGAPKPDTIRATRRTRQPRRLLTSTRLIALGSVLVLGLAFWLATRQAYFVGVDQSRGNVVTMYQGVPYDLPFGLSLYSPVRHSGVTLASVPSDHRSTFTDHELRSKDGAEDLLLQLEQGRLD